MKERVFKKRKWYIVIGILLLLSILIIGGYFLSVLPIDLDEQNPILILIGLILIFKILKTLMKSFKLLFSNTPALILNKEGIFIDGQTDGFIIPWADIKEIRSKYIPKSEKCIFITVYNTEEHIELISSICERMKAKVRNFQYGTPYIFSASPLGITTESLVAQLNEYLEDYHTQTNK